MPPIMPICLRWFPHNGVGVLSGIGCNIINIAASQVVLDKLG